jgi:AcrR family transcriptional regulator
MDTKVTAILKAARARFAHYGLGKTTMNDIANDIGMSKAALYYYFQDKEQVFVAVVEQDIAEFVNTIEQLIERPSKPSFKLKKYASLRNQLLAKLYNLGKVENPSPADLFNPIFDQLKITYITKEKTLVQQMLQLGIDEKEYVRFNVPRYADLFVSALIGLRTNAVTASEPLRKEMASIEEQSRLFVEIFLKAIKVG